jgi:outer membrane receptor protein involved in Fe transport
MAKVKYLISTSLFTASVFVASAACGQSLPDSQSSAPAQANGTSPQEPVASLPQEQDGSSGKDQSGDIVVTGSRIARRDYSSQSPIVTVSRDAVSVSGQQTLGEALNELPQLTPGNSATNANRANAGQTNPDLRGLGSRRTLVLLDGRRLQPSDPFNAIDLNTVPETLIQNVEIITGGASAVYGSDALAGVINLKTKTDFTGLELDGQGGVTSRGDGGNYSLSATAGTNFAEGRGNIVVSGSYLNREEITPQSSRPFFNQFTTPAVSPTGRFPLTGVPQAAITALFNSYGITDPTKIPTAADQAGINPDGTLFVYQSSNAAAVGSNFRAGEPGQPIMRFANGVAQIKQVDRLQLSSPLERYTGFARASFKISDNVSIFLQGNYTHSMTSVGGAGAQITSAAPTIPTTNFFYQQTDLFKLLSLRATDTPLALNILNYPVPDPTEITTDLYQIQGGASGKIPSLGWSWDIYFAHGETKTKYVDDNKVSRTAFLQLTTAADGGTSQCAGGVNFFPAVAISPACANLLLTDAVSRQVLTQDLGEANLQGGIFKLPGGDVRFAVGVAYRRNSFSFSPDSRLAPLNALDQTEVFGYGSFYSLPTSGSTRAIEGYGELLLPVLANTPFFQRFDLDLAYRYSNYDTVGGVNTYKAGLEWEPVHGLLLRGGYQRAIRAPSVGELFAAQVRGVGDIGQLANGGGDPCSVLSTARAASNPNAGKVAALCIATGVPASLIGGTRSLASQTTIILAGNPNAQEETSDSYTIGTVLQPRFSSPYLSKLSLSVDYYNINIKNALGTRQARDILDTCYNLNGLNPGYSATNEACLLIKRAGADQPTRMGDLDKTSTPTINLARYQTTGIDAQLDYEFPIDQIVPNGGALAFNVLATYLMSYKLQNATTAPVNEFAGTIGNGAISGLSHPRWKGLATVTYKNSGSELGFRLRYIGSMTNSANVGTSATQAGVDSILYTDLFGRIAVGQKFELRLGVTNLFDKMPPIFTGQNATDPATYDVIGRTFYAGFKASF